MSPHQRAKANITQYVILHEPCLNSHARQGAGAAASPVFCSECVNHQHDHRKGNLPRKISFSRSIEFYWTLRAPIRPHNSEVKVLNSYIQ